MLVDQNQASGATLTPQGGAGAGAARTSATPSRPAEPAKGQAPRRLDCELAAAVSLFADSPLLASGQITVVSLEAIAARLGDRWASRRASVHEYTERSLARHFGDTGHFLKASDTDFLVMAHNIGKFGGQLRCLQCLREVLTHFLGEPRPADLTVSQVTRISTTELEAVPVDPALAAAGADREKSEADADADSDISVSRWSPFTASNGRQIRVSCALEPVLELKTFKMIGHRIVRRILYVATETALTAKELRSLSRSDIERIDCATIARGLHRLRTDDGAQPLTLIIPVSFTSLSNRLGRSALAQLFSEARSLVKTGVICEVCDIEGVPQTALLEATSQIKPHCVFLIGHLQGTPERGLGGLRGAGFRGISFEAPEGLISDADFVAWARPAIQAVKTIAKSLLIYRLASSRHVGLAATMGASHASLQPGALTAPARVPGQP